MTYTHLTEEQRYQIWADHKVGRCCGKNSEATIRSKATISRVWQATRGDDVIARRAKPGRRTATATRRAFKLPLKTLADRVLTCTLDNGREFAGHPGITQDLNAKIYFAYLYASWRWSTVETTNCLIQQNLSKTCDLCDLSGRKIQKIEHRLNFRLRKCLDYLTPYEVFHNSPLHHAVESGRIERMPSMTLAPQHQIAPETASLPSATRARCRDHAPRYRLTQL